LINNKKLIGVCLSKIQDEFRTDYMSSLHRFANENGYKIIVFNSLRDLYFGDINDIGSKRIFEVINYDILDALILLCDSIYDKETAHMIIDRAHEHNNVPVILVHGDEEGCVCIQQDYTSAYKQVIEHMVTDHGAKSFVFIGGLRTDDPATVKRLSIVREVLEKHDLELPEANILYGDYWDVPAKMAVQSYLNNGNPLPDAIICANDTMAMGVCEELKNFGYKVPDDVKITGFDGLGSAEYFMPRLTTCKEDVPYLAELSIKLINGCLDGTVSPGTFPETYMAYIGESCGCMNSMSIDYRKRASILYHMNYDMHQHEKHIYSLADSILNSDNLNTLSSVLSSYILPNSSVCLNESFIMSSLSRTGDKPTEQEFSELIVITSMGENFKSGKLGRFPIRDMVPDIDVWLNDNTLCILTPIYMNDESCGYYAVKTDDIFNTTHKVFRVSKIMNIAFGALINRLSKTKMQSSIQNAMYVDPLSGLPNLKGLSKWFNEFSAVEENHQKVMMFSVYNIPQYRFIYENYGIEDIENAIRFIADALCLANKDNGFIARSGTDEFIVVNYVDNEEDVSTVINNAVSVFYGIIEGYNTGSDKDYYVEVNCGCTVANPGWNSSLRTFLKLANAEMYMNRLKAGLTPVVKDDKSENKQKIKDMYSEFSILIEKNLFNYFFQPIIDAKTGEIYAYEALMRSAGGINLSPLDILAVAKEYNKLYDIEKATLFNVMERYAREHDKFAGAKVFINTIPGSFLEENDLNELKDRYGEYMPNFVFEITEQDTVSDDELNTLRSLGNPYVNEGSEGKIAVDDYGTGHSNIVNLLRYAPHIIKIDRFLISNIQNDPNKQMFVKSTIEFARMNNIKVLAEGVETYEEMKKVIEFGVDLIQGFYTAKPAPEPIREIPQNIRDEVIKENILASRFGSELNYYIIDSDETINLYKLALDKYGFILIRKGNVRFVGTRDYAIDIPIFTDDNSDVKITFENVCLRCADEPTVKFGKNSKTELTLEGTSTLLKNGIYVPEDASLTFKGDGSLKISLKTNGGVGIGSNYDGSFGSISFEQTGKITIELFIDKGVGVGGGIQGENTKISFLNGSTIVEAKCVESVGVGSVKGSAVIDIGPDAELISHCSGKSALGLGSFDGSCEISSCGKLDLQADGELCTALGTLDKGNAVISVTGGNTYAVVHGDNAVCIGSINGHADITCSGGRVVAYGEGDHVTGYGSGDGTGITRISAGTAAVKILSGDIQQFGSAVCRTIITGGNIIPAQKDQINAVNIFGQRLHCEKLEGTDSYEKTFTSGKDEYIYRARRESPSDEFCVYVP